MIIIGNGSQILVDKDKNISYPITMPTKSKTTKAKSKTKKTPTQVSEDGGEVVKGSTLSFDR
ncbi:MAG: hypothetical protein AABY22_15515 [Nanoarchaeota archaeon]